MKREKILEPITKIFSIEYARFVNNADRNETFPASILTVKFSRTILTKVVCPIPLYQIQELYWEDFLIQICPLKTHLPYRSTEFF